MSGITADQGAGVARTPGRPAGEDDLAPPPPAPPASPGPTDRRFELAEALVLALAALLTAWCAFQSTKWGGTQADDYSRAGAARTESNRAFTRAGQATTVDVNTFTAWVDAITAERRAGVDPGLAEDGSYEPQAGTESSFLYQRFPPELRVAFDAWLASEPFTNPDAAPTPFALPEYQVAEQQRSADLDQQADAFAAQARAANQYGDNYVMLTIAFALVLVLVGIGSKMDTTRARGLLLGLAFVAIVAAGIAMLTYPVEI